jgi:Fis family transcriptional regulator
MKIIGNELKNHIKDYLITNQTDPTAIIDMRWVVRATKKIFVDELLMHTHGNQTKAASIAGINRGTLRSIYNSKDECN